jgi:hypothetical protein
MLREKGNALCLSCHGPNPPIGPFADSISAKNHKLDTAGSECVACHMPLIEETLKDVKVHAHTFRFMTPSTTQTLSVPNPCTLWHTDKILAWTDRSPWRSPRSFWHPYRSAPPVTLGLLVHAAGSGDSVDGEGSPR